MEGGMSVEVFPSISAIIESLAAIYPGARISKGTDAAGDLCVTVILKDGSVKTFGVRDCQGSGYFITDMPGGER
jgi:hypothetical protein